MRSLSLELGKQHAFNTFGIKYASEWNKYLKIVKQQMIGNPTEALKQFQRGTLMKPGKGLLHNGLPHNAGEIAASLALPLMGSYMLARNSPSTSKGEVVGNFLGRTVGSMLGHPLAGAAGQIGGGMLLAPVGQAIGKTLSNSDVVES